MGIKFDQPLPFDIRVSCDTVVVGFVPSKTFLETLNKKYFKFRYHVFQNEDDLSGFELYEIDLNDFRNIGEGSPRFAKAVNVNSGEIRDVRTDMPVEQEKRFYKVPSSWSYDIVIEYRSDTNVRLSLSIPKYLYGHNIIEWPDCKPSEFLSKLDNFFHKFFRKHFNEEFFSLEPTYLRVDFGKNYHFSSYQRKLEWFANAQTQYRFIATNVYKDSAETATGTIEFKKDSWYMKIYDKGLEFEKHDLKRLRKMYGYDEKIDREKLQIDKRFEYLRKFAQNCVRIEYECRGQHLTELWLKTIEYQDVDSGTKKKIKAATKSFNVTHNIIQQFREMYSEYWDTESFYGKAEKFIKNHLEFAINPISLNLLRKSSLISCFSHLSYNQYYGVKLPSIKDGRFEDRGFEKEFAHLFAFTHKQYLVYPEGTLTEMFFGSEQFAMYCDYKQYSRLRPCVPRACKKDGAHRVFGYNGSVRMRPVISLNSPIIYEVYRTMYKYLSACNLEFSTDNLKEFFIQYEQRIKDLTGKGIDKFLRHLDKKRSNPQYCRHKVNKTTFYRLEREMNEVLDLVKDNLNDNDIENFTLWQRINHNRLKLQ